MRLAKMFVVVLAAFLFVGSANATSFNTDVSDLWWNPNESGWGMQMVNTGSYIYATIYVYGPDGKPIWYAAGLDNVGSFTWTGKLYTATGPYFGGPASPNFARQVGTMTFVLTTVTNGQLSYSVDGVVVNKSIQRQPLTLDYYGGSYDTIYTESVTGCHDPANNGPKTLALVGSIGQTGQSMTMVLSDSTGIRCTFSGTYSQLGRMGTFASAYSCNSGTVGNVLFFEMNNTVSTFTARLQGQNTTLGCSFTGTLIGVIPQ